MDSKAYIETGILEAYVYGLLPEEENIKVNTLINEYPEIKQEVAAIEHTLKQLTESSTPIPRITNYSQLKSKLNLQDPKIKQLKPNNTSKYVGWAAAAILAIGLSFTYSNYNFKTIELNQVATTNKSLKDSLNIVSNKLEAYNYINTILANKKVNKTVLPGQGNFENTYAVAYVNPETNEVYIDASGLPKAPEGMVYQVWSLTFDPLTPTSIGLLDDTSTAQNNFYKVAYQDNTQAYGITLEKAGGSKAPNLDQLYTLGKV